MTDEGDVVIIGGGIGGLFTGALLAKNGQRVIVLEKNEIIGGGLQSFQRGDVSFDTGMHILGGFREGGNVRRICEYLGVFDKLQIRDVDDDCIDSIHYFSDGSEVHIPCGREAFVDYLSSLFPKEAVNIRNYVDKLYDITREVPLFWLLEDPDSFMLHDDDFYMPADELINRYVSDVRLRDILGYMNPMYGGVPGHTPAFIHAIINVLYISGPSRFVGPSRNLADKLADVIRDNGGVVYNRHKVVRVATSDRQVQSVITENGDIFKGRWYVSDIHPALLIDLCDEGSFPKSFTSRVKSMPNTYSAFQIYLKLYPKSFPYINHTCYAQDDYGMVWDYCNYDADTWPHGFMYMTPPMPAQRDYASKMIINVPMPFSAVKDFEQRGLAYRAWKLDRAERVLAKMALLYPGFLDAIEDMYTSSPLTIRDYYGSVDGALYGVRADSQNLLATQLQVFTKLRNLLLTGQNVNLHGICGVPLTAIKTAEGILGRNEILKQING